MGILKDANKKLLVDVVEMEQRLSTANAKEAAKLKKEITMLLSRVRNCLRLMVGEVEETAEELPRALQIMQDAMDSEE